MKNKNLIFLVGVITVLAIAAFGYTLVSAMWYAPDTEIPVPGKETTIALPDEYPDGFEIPKLDISTHVQHVGVNAKGNMANPDNFVDVGWYEYGTVPGKVGSAVFAGHLDNALRLDGVFKRLDELEVGDDAYVITAGGERLHYVVQEIATYNYLQVPLEKLFNRKDRARLNLVTCEGTWLKDQKTYDKRRIVYTVLAP